MTSAPSANGAAYAAGSFATHAALSAAATSAIDRAPFVPTRSAWTEPVGWTLCSRTADGPSLHAAIRAANAPKT